MSCCIILYIPSAFMVAEWKINFIAFVKLVLQNSCTIIRVIFRGFYTVLRVTVWNIRELVSLVVWLLAIKYTFHVYLFIYCTPSLIEKPQTRYCEYVANIFKIFTHIMLKCFLCSFLQACCSLLKYFTLYSTKGVIL